MARPPLLCWGAEFRLQQKFPVVVLDLSCLEIAPRSKSALSARAAGAAHRSAALLVLDLRSGITSGVSTVAPLRFDANPLFLAARQLSPFSVPSTALSIPTFVSCYLPRFMAGIPRTLPVADHLRVISNSRAAGCAGTGPSDRQISWLLHGRASSRAAPVTDGVCRPPGHVAARGAVSATASSGQTDPLYRRGRLPSRSTAARAASARRRQSESGQESQRRCSIR